MTAAARCVGTPAIAEMADGPHLTARPVILWSMTVSGLEGHGLRRAASPPAPPRRPARVRLAGLRAARGATRRDEAEGARRPEPGSPALRVEVAQHGGGELADVP